MSDWDASDDETTAKTTTRAVVAPKPLKKASKWEGEDEDDDGPVVSHPLPKPHIPYRLHSTDLH